MFIMKENKKQVLNKALRGFTLTEVIVVIVMIAALAIILIPNMLNLMPDDHNIKYKKAFYTMQEIVNDIASQCQGMKNDGYGNWSTISETEAENVLQYCYRENYSRHLADEICNRLSTTSECDTSVGGNDNKDIQTTNNMHWWIPQRILNTSFTNSFTIYVSVDGDTINNGIVSNYSSNITTNQNNGIFRIIVTKTGKVQTPSASDGQEANYLMKNPTGD